MFCHAETLSEKFKKAVLFPNMDKFVVNTLNIIHGWLTLTPIKFFFKGLRSSVLLMIQLTLIFLVNSPPTDAMTPDRIIKDITIDGLSSISKAEFLYLLDLKAGDTVNPAKVTDGIKRAFLKGIFEDIEVYAEDPGGEGNGREASLKIIVRERDVIKKVRISGNTALSAREIRHFFSFKEGQVMRYDLLEEAIKGLRHDLSERGFPRAEAAIEIERAKEPYRVDLLVTVNEGQPELIRRIKIQGPEEEVKSVMKISEGDVYDQFQIKSDVERIKKYYKDQGYFNPVVGPYRFHNSTLDLTVNPGRKLSISFEGNSAIGSKDLRKEMPFFDAGDFRDDLVEEASAKISALYHAAGYPFVQIAPVVTTEKDTINIHFFVYEGEMVKVGSVRFSGVTLPEKNLKEIMSLKEGGAYNPDSLFFDRETLGEFYNALGYLTAEVQEPEVKIKDSVANIHIVIAEGNKTTVNAVEITGAQSVPLEELRKAAGIKVGDPYNEVDVYEARYRIIDLYLERGFVSINVDTKRELEPQGAKITFEINEGKPEFFGKTIILGNQRTKTVVVERELLHREGKPFNQSQLMKERQKLYKLGLFADVTVEPLDKYDSRRDVLVTVKEGNAGAVEFGVGYGDFEKYRGFLDIGYRNLFGMNRQGSFRIELSSLERRYILNYYDPWFLNRPTPFRALLLYENRKERNIDTGEILYKLKRHTATAGFEKKLSETVKGELYYEFSLVNTSDVQPDVILTKEDTGTLAISGIRAGLIYDTRNNPFDPRRGILAGVAVKAATKYLLSETDFAKVSFNVNHYRSLSERFVLAISLRGGAAKGFGATDELPLVERFFLGGRSTVRGYDQDMLGPKGVDGNPTGGNAFLLANIELRTSLGKGIGIVTFLDGGNVWQKTANMDLSLKYAAGMGLRYSTPVGPLRVDYGYKLNRALGESHSEIHFSIGQAF